MRRLKLVSSAFFVLLMLGVFSSLSYADDSAQATAPLLNEDCSKCHDGPPADIAVAGMKHKDVSCQDCHTGHKPKVEKSIPECNQCHVGTKHFETKDCLSCHRNPHKPLNIVFPGNITEPCLACHDQQNIQLTENKSKHSKVSCTRCHGTSHRTKPECIKCHKPHSSDMVASDCNKCHKAHMPKVITYDDVPAKLCAGCHKTAFDVLSASTAKHQTFNCSTCHKTEHKMIPKCKTCHGDMHPASIMVKFPKCSDCHKTAHDINNWTAPVSKQPVKKTR
ncbi:MAG: cytochrome C [Nitrospirae bacterium GWC2_42_7]|nr:MAG: cytochrome C [Nitrospirae bacterium GWC2_42_7]